MNTLFPTVTLHCFQNEFQSPEHVHLQYLCLFVPANKLLSPKEMDTFLGWMWIAFWSSEALIHVRVPSAVLFPSKPPEPKLPPWGSAASVKWNHKSYWAEETVRLRMNGWLSSVMWVCWWTTGAQRTASGRAAKSRVFRTSHYSAVIVVLNVIFQKFPELPVGFALVWIKSKHLSF